MAIVCSTSLAITGAFMASPEPAAAAEPVRVLTYNFCGAICNKGVVTRPGNDNDVVEDVRNRILATRPHLVMLQEACAGQVDRIKDLLKSSGWSMDGVFRPQRQDGRCKGASRGFGDAVLTAGRVGAREVLDLPDLGGENRAILCLDTDAHGPVLACSLHLVTGRSGAGRIEHTRQLAASARVLNAKAAGRAVIIGGDFNAPPGQMGSLIDPGKGGRFFDVDPRLAATHGRKKIDYVLFSRAHFSNPSGGPVGSRWSDHKLLPGSATRG